MRECQKRASKKWNAANKDKMREYDKKSYQKHKIEKKKKRLMKSIENILKIVSDYYSIPEIDLKGDSRKTEIVKAKHVYFYLSFTMTKNSLSKIGELVNKEHCTVIHGKAKIHNQLPFYKDLQNEIYELKNIIRPKNNLVIEHFDLLELSNNYAKSFLVT